MPSRCVFEFERPQPVYYSGETINGSIQLHTTNEKTVRELYLLFEGMATVRWEEIESSKRDNTYRSNETYLKTRTRVHGEGKLQPGTYTYTFHIPLPLECPSSCVESCGKVQYELSLVLDRPYRFNNIFKQSLTVVHQVDLNLQPDLLIPLKSEHIKYFCCWHCTSEPVLFTLIIPFGGYVPGEKIKYTLEIDNQSGYDLADTLELKLIQYYSFFAQTPREQTRVDGDIVALAVEGLPCLRLSKRLIAGELLVPSVPPTLEMGYIISVRYELEMCIDTAFCRIDSEMKIPITIGTVPLAQGVMNRQNAIDLLPTAPTAPDTPGLSFGSAAPPNYDISKPPPSFEEATNNGARLIYCDVEEHI